MKGWRCHDIRVPLLPMRLRAWFCAGWLLPISLVSCVGPTLSRQLTGSAAERAIEFRAMLDRVETAPLRPIPWQKAHQRMLQENLALRQSHKMLVDAQKLTRRQWLSLVPRTAGFLNITQNLGNAKSFGGESLATNLVASFNIPNPFEFYAMLYGAALQAQDAQWSNQLDARRAYAELYSAFMEAATLRKEEASLERQRQALMAGDISADFPKALTGVINEASSLKNRRLSHRSNVNRLLNTPGGNWDLVGAPPSLSYRTRYRTIKIGRDFGMLALNLYVIQIESAILETERVKFQRWPSLSFGLSNPPLYSSNQSNRFSGENFVLFAGAYKSLEINDLGNRESIRDAEYRLRVTREQLQMSMEREATRLLQIRDAYDQLLKEERHLEVAIKQLDHPATSETKAVLADLELLSQLEMQLLQVKRQIKQLDLQYLIWDELFWKS